MCSDLTVSACPHPAPHAEKTPPGRFTDFTLGPDKKLWIAAYESDQIWTYALDGTFQPLDLPVDSGPSRIARGSDGNMWVAEFKADAIDRITTAGVRTRFKLKPGRGPNDIAAGPDGALWFTEYSGNAIGRMTTAGQLTTSFPSRRPPAARGASPPDLTARSGSPSRRARRSVGSSSTDRAPAADGGGSGGGVTDRVAPRFDRGLRVSPSRFRLAGAPTPTSARSRTTPKGSSLTYSLSEPASVTIVIAQPRSGRRVGRSCRAPSRSNRRNRRCTRYVTVGTLKRRGLQGANKVVFTGRIGRRALAPSSYRGRRQPRTRPATCPSPAPPRSRSPRAKPHARQAPRKPSASTSTAVRALVAERVV